MNESLQSRETQIIEILERHPERGADLLIDFAKLYASDPKVEDEAILAKLQLIMTDQLNEKNIAKTKLIELTQRIVQDYNPVALSTNKAKEIALANSASKFTIHNDLVLKAEKIRKHYNRSNFTLELDHLDLRLGEITGLVGENATGKTSLLRLLAGDLAPDSGVLHYPLFVQNNRFSWPELKCRIAYVPQELPVWKGALVDNLRFEASLHGLTGIANRSAIDYIVQRFGLANHLNKTWQELSGGYKLRFSLAKALIWKAQLLIVDEPLAFLDIKTQMIVLNDLKNLARSLRHPLAILLSSQHIHEIEAVADQLIFMRNGQIENLGSAQEWGNNRKLNLFEFITPLDYNKLRVAFDGIPYRKLWSNGMVWFASTELEVSGMEFLQFLIKKQIEVIYFRDISRSIKTKFYEEQI
jgi:ABC-2 type transport system ATP-binding protein